MGNNYSQQLIYNKLKKHTNMKTLKTGILTVIIAFYCSLNVQAQENARGKLKGKIVKSSDTGMASVSMDTLSNTTSDSGKKGLNAVNVKLARGVDKKDSRKNVGVSPDTISDPTLRKGWDGSIKGKKTDAEFMSKKGYEYYQSKSDNSTSKQTQGATFGEKVNQGARIKEGDVSIEKDSIPASSVEKSIKEK